MTKEIDGVSQREDREWGLVVMVERTPASRVNEMDQRAIRIWRGRGGEVVREGGMGGKTWLGKDKRRKL